MTDSNVDSSVLNQSVDTAAIASVEGAPYLARNIPVGDVSATSMVGMIPQLSPNQTGYQLIKTTVLPYIQI